MCQLRVEAIMRIQNETIAWGWSSSSLNCLIMCQFNDQISAIAAYHSNEEDNSQIYGYSYSTFSGYMLLNTE